MKNTELNDICIDVFEANKLKGFDVSTSNIGQTLMLVVSELAEALEADRKNKHANNFGFDSMLWKDQDPELFETKENFKQSFECCIKDTFEDEIADTIIRLMDLCGGLGINIDRHIELKRKYNLLRAYKHGGKAY